MSKTEDTRRDADVQGVEEKPAGMKSYLRVFRYANRAGLGLYAVSILAAVAAGTTLPIMNIVFGKFVTTFNSFATGALSASGYMHEVEKLALDFVYLFIAKFALVYIHTASVSFAAIGTTKALRVDFLRSLLRQDMTYFDTKAGDSASIQVTTNGNIINNGISDKFSLTMQALATFVSAFVVAFAIQWKLTLITIAIVPVVIIVTGLCIAIDVPIEAKVVSAYSKAGSLAEEVFSTITTVHAFWLQASMAARYDSHLADAQQHGIKKSAIYGFMFSAQFFSIYSGYGLAFWQGIRMYVSGEIREPGDVVTVIFALILATTSMQQIALQTLVVTKAATAASELFNVIDRSSAIDGMSDAGYIPPDCNGRIEINGVIFQYPSRPDTRVLDDFTLDIPAKQTTALVGVSGSGKSTIIGLLERWYDQSDGSILLDGVDIRTLNVRWLRTRVRLVQQEPVLFSGTIFDNVAHGLIGTEYEHAPQTKQMELVQAACKDSFAHDFIESLPQKYLTPVGERARMLSGGQRQRVAIARSIVSNPPVLLLDEATSALDPYAEQIVQEALDNVGKHRTTLIIAHKLSTIQKADNIAVMYQGGLVEQGTHKELLEQDGVYASVVHAQDLVQTNENKRRTDAMPDQGPDGSSGGDAPRQLPLAKTAASADTNKHAIVNDQKKQITESMGYGLIRCFFMLVREQRSIWPLYGLLALSSTFAGGTWPALAILFSRMFGTFQLQGSAAIREGDFWALMFFVVGIANLVIYFSIGVTCNIINQRVTRRYRLETFTNTIKQDNTFFDQETNATGAITSRLSTCATDLQELLGMNSGIILNNIVTVLSCTILGIAYGWKLGLACTFGALPPLLLSGYARIRLETKFDDDTVRRFAESAALATECVASIRTVASLALEGIVLKEYENRLSAVASRSRRILIPTMFLYAISQSINFLAMALGFWYGGKLVSTGEYSNQQFFVVFIAVVLGGENAAQIFSYSTGIMKARAAANYIFWLRHRRSAIPEDEGGHLPDSEKEPSEPASIDCNGLSFAYPSRPKTRVIQGVDIKIPAGSFIALVGASGCGKSTMVSLLARFYDPSLGAICVNNKSITEIGPRQHRRRLGLVQQEPVLYSGSIRENVANGVVESHEPNEEQVEDALRSANILDFVRSLPEGMRTAVGNRGTQLSGGQRQRIAIARALIRDPKILLLDEATSALDTESEQVVQKALMEAARDGRRSTIAVAHRLSTIKDADTILVFQDGKIIEIGTHMSLYSQRGTYFEMCKGQALDNTPS